MKRKNFLLMAIIAFLVVAVAILASMNKEIAKEKDETSLLIKMGSQQVVISFEELLRYQPSTFIANVKSSGKDPVPTEFTGVLLSTILQDKGFNLSGSEQVTFKAIDGYQTNVLGSEVLEDENIYVVYKREGEFTKSRAQGGSGPMEIVIAKDPFSQRWNKFLVEIVIVP